MKTRLAIILPVLVVILGCGGFAVWYFFLRTVRPDFDQLGGTILVYALAPQEKDDPERVEKLARALSQRLDPDDGGLAIVQPVGKDRVEVRIPRMNEKHAEEMVRIKALVLATGVLEFRILANDTDDKKGIAAAREMLNFDVDLKQELKDLQEKGSPPPGPRDPKTREPALFSLDLPGGQKSIVSYSWVELGPQERLSLNLDNAAEFDPQRNKVWLEAKKVRGQATVLNVEPRNVHLMQGALFYSRECLDRNLPEEERRKKAVDYFVLARDPEIDPNLNENLPVVKRRTRAIDGSCLTAAYAESRWNRGIRAVGAPDREWFVSFSLNPEGTELFRTLTRKNVSSGAGAEDTNVRRHLAIILDGLVMSAPTINSEIGGGKGQISGSFTEREVRSLAAILRTGALPPGLMPLLVSEKDVPGKAAK